jgi:hypothetical protein
VAVTEDRLSSDVRRGENHGKTPTHAAAVRQEQRSRAILPSAAATLKNARP